jgi:serine/threonine-protein kinase
VAPGTVVGGRFVVEGLLGSGGMGVVVLARHRELGELRAIKLLRSDRVLDDGARRRLLHEARAAARIQSAHVVRVFDVVTDDPECPYVVMERLVGETLADRLGRGPLSVSTTARMVVETCEALAEAHRNGTVHRDLKPSNLFLTSADGRDDFVKILDFGIAKTDEARFGGDWTHSRALLATPAYASPEQLRASRDVDARSDIWSLGVIIYQCLTGRVPFEGGTLAETSSRILRDEPSSLRGHRPDVPADLERLVARSLEKQREARFPNVEALVEALARFAPDAAATCLDRLRALSAPSAEASGPPPAAPPDARQVETLIQSSLAGVALDAGSAPAARRRRPRGPAQWAVLGAVVAVIVMAAVPFLGSARPGGRKTPSVPEPAIAVTAPLDLPRRESPAAAAKVAPATEQPPMAVHETVRERPRSHAHAPRPRPAAVAGPTQPESPAGTGGARALVPLDELRLDQLIDERK